MTDLIELQNVSFSYGGPSILKDINLRVTQGEFIGLVGPNAGGKSTLLKLMLGLLKPTRGEIKLFGKTPIEGRKKIGYCPQYADFSRNFPITVEEVVLLGCLGKDGIFGRYSRQDREIVLRAMQSTEVDTIRNENISELSGGQLQRVLIARALACQPEVMILDEPTANIDQRVEMDIFELLRGLNKQMTIIVVSHDIGFISGYVTRVACLNRTLVCHKTSELTGESIEQLYGGHIGMIEHNH